MARTIGRKNISLVKRLVDEEFVKSAGGYNVDDAVIDRLPVEVFETWEGARSEIDNIIGERTSDIAHAETEDLKELQRKAKMREFADTERKLKKVV